MSKKFKSDQIKVMIGCLLISGFMMGLCISTMTLYVQSLSEALDKPLVSITLIFTVMGAGAVVGAFFMGAIIKALGYKKMLALSAVFAAVYYIILGFIPSFAAILVGSFLLGIASVLAGYSGTQNTMSNWFPNGLGKASGIVTVADAVIKIVAVSEAHRRFPDT